MKLDDKQKHYMMLGIVITIALMALFVGHRIGFRQGYSYVLEYEEEYIDRYCECIEPAPSFNCRSRVNSCGGSLILPEGLVFNVSYS